MNEITASSSLKAIIMMSPLWWPLALVLEYLGIAKEAFVLLSVLAVGDLLFGFLASLITHTTSSNAIWKGCIKKASLILLVLMSAYYSKVVGWGLELFNYGLITALINAEFLSIFKNFYTIWTGEKIKEVDLVKATLKKLISALSSKQ